MAVLGSSASRLTAGGCRPRRLVRRHADTCKPRRRSCPCSPTSSVLSVSLTAPSRSSSAMTSGLPVAALRTASQGGDGALPVPVQEASMHARVPDDAGWYGSSLYRIRPCCLLLPRRHRHPGLNCFRRSQPGLHTPLSTLRVTPRGATRMTRGRCGSLPLHRSGLSPPTSCRSPGAPWLNPTPQMITVYASPWSSPSPTQHSLPGGRYPLPGPDFHRLDRASFAWRTANQSARKTRGMVASAPPAHRAAG